MRCVVLGIALFASRSADAYVLHLPRTPSVPSSTPREERIHMCSEQSATAEFTTDDEILAALRPKEVRTDRPEFTTDDELLAALNRNEDALNSARATLDREK